MQFVFNKIHLLFFKTLNNEFFLSNYWKYSIIYIYLNNCISNRVVVTNPHLHCSFLTLTRGESLSCSKVMWYNGVHLVFSLSSFVLMYRARIYDVLKVLNEQANGVLAQGKKCVTRMTEVPSSNPIGGNILQLDLFFVFSWFCRIYRLWI